MKFVKFQKLIFICRFQGDLIVFSPWFSDIWDNGLRRIQISNNNKSVTITTVLFWPLKGNLYLILVSLSGEGIKCD